ncbi:hypothetical protein BJX70DRAFT_123426 [Aspergillus crustosus]
MKSAVISIPDYNRTMRPTTTDEFEIAIFCALGLEADAVEAIFDETYDEFGKYHKRQPGDTNVYLTGRIGQHNVVLCYLPGIGKGAAAAAAANLRVSYRQVRLALVVGTCGGVPFLPGPTVSEVVLGDVIISNSVVQYDFGRQNPDRFVAKKDVLDRLGRPNQEIRAILNAINGHKARKNLQKRISEHLQVLRKQPDMGWQYPGAQQDVLFESTVARSPIRRPIKRQRLTGGGADPAFHIGRFASGSGVIKSGEHRDRIADEEGAIGFEMEGAGVWDNLPCIIIKGVCNYADSYKNNTWQHYAAATAACCTKAFLEVWQPTLTDSILPTQPLSLALQFSRYYMASRRLDIQRISGELLPIDQCYIKLAIVPKTFSSEKSVYGSSHGSPLSRLNGGATGDNELVTLPALFDQQTKSTGTSIIPKRVLIHGRAGVGKTTLCKRIVHDYFHQGMWRHLFDVVLWIPLRKLKGMPQEGETFESILHQLYFSDLANGKQIASELHRSMMDPVQKDRLLLILDGLDEVSQEWAPETSRHNFLHHLLNYPRIIITSRTLGISSHALNSPDLELEVTGFEMKQVEAYIRTVTKDDAQTAKKILSFIETHQVIKGLVQIPIQLDALCYSLSRGFMVGDRQNSMTSVYPAIIRKLLQKDLLRLRPSRAPENMNEFTIRSLSTLDIQSIIPHETKLIEYLAFTGIFSNLVDLSADHRRRIYDTLYHQGISVPDLPETALQRVSFLHSSDANIMEADKSCHFLHVTFQEFFAAQYFVWCWLTGTRLLSIDVLRHTPTASTITPQDFLRTHKYSSRFDTMWRFVAGLLQSALKPATQLKEPLGQFFDEIEAQPRDLLGPAHLRLLWHCLAEVRPDTQGKRIEVLVEKQTCNWLLFEISSWNRSRRSLIYGELPARTLIRVLREGSSHVVDSILDILEYQRPLSTEVVDGLFALYRVADAAKKDRVRRILTKRGTLVRRLSTDSIFTDFDTDQPPFGNPGKPLQVSPETLRSLLSYAKSRDNDINERSISGELLAQQTDLTVGVLEALRALLADPDPRVRLSVLEGLQYHESSQTAIHDLVLSALGDRDKSLRLAAASIICLWKSSPPIFSKTLGLLLADADQDVRKKAENIVPMCRCLTPSQLEALLSRLTSDHAIKKTILRIALQEKSGCSASIIVRILPLLADDIETYRYLAYRALRSQRTLPSAVIDRLAPLLSDHRFDVRSAAALLLSQHPSLLSPTISRTLRDDEITIRMHMDYHDPHERSRRDAGEVDQALPPLSADNLITLVLLIDAEGQPHTVEAATNVLANQKYLPRKALDKLRDYLWDRDMERSKRALRLLCIQPYISGQDIDAVALLLPRAIQKHGHSSSQLLDILEILANFYQQRALPNAVTQDLLHLLLQSESYEIKQCIGDVLRKQPGLLANLPAKYWGPLYEAWLYASFEQQLSVYFVDNTLHLNNQEGVSIVTFTDKKQLRIVKHEIYKMQVQLKVPGEYLCQVSRGDRAASGISTVLPWRRAGSRGVLGVD